MITPLLKQKKQRKESRWLLLPYDRWRVYKEKFVCKKCKQNYNKPQHCILVKQRLHKL